MCERQSSYNGQRASRSRREKESGRQGESEREQNGATQASRANGGLTSGHLQHGLCAGQCFLHSMRNAFMCECVCERVCECVRVPVSS